MEQRINLEDLRPAEGATHKTKRVGRGRSSGMGKTSSRGNNGEGQRSGRSSKRGFEGGQMPGYRKMPKLKGVSVVRPVRYAEVNVSSLDSLGVKEVTLDLLKEKNLANKSTEALRVLGNGEVTKAVTVKAAYFTASAKEKIEKAGGKAEVI
jgi:large subunit ribosomal protein L15